MAVFRYVVRAASSVESCLKGQNRLSPGYPLSVKAGRRLATHFITGNNGWLIPRLPRACHRPKYPCSCQKPRSRRVFGELQGNSLHAAAGDTGESERRQGYARGTEGLARKGEQPSVIKYKQEETVRLLLLHDPCFLYIYPLISYLYLFVHLYGINICMCVYGYVYMYTHTYMCVCISHIFYMCVCDMCDGAEPWASAPRFPLPPRLPLSRYRPRPVALIRGWNKLLPTSLFLTSHQRFRLLTSRAPGAPRRPRIVWQCRKPFG